MTYAYQLVTPFFLWFTYSLFNSPLKNLPSAKVINNHNFVLIMPCILLSLYLLYSSVLSAKTSSESFHMERWEKIHNITLSYKNILNSPILVSSLMEQKKTIYDAGQTEYFQHSHYSFAWLNGLLLPNADISKQWEKYDRSIRETIARQGFDAIMITSREHSVCLREFEKYYFLTDTVEVCMFQSAQCMPLEIWIPNLSDITNSNALQ
jgi:hypothetical protein